uniref:hypothetical protein n=1 Tax=Nocardia cyriacigeorgica TaxID=135487 RepID=UPI002456EB14
REDGVGQIVDIGDAAQYLGAEPVDGVIRAVGEVGEVDVEVGGLHLFHPLGFVFFVESWGLGGARPPGPPDRI